MLHLWHRLQRFTKTVRFKLLLIGEVVIICAIVAMLLPIRRELRLQVIDGLQDQLRAIAATAALQLDGDQHAKIESEADWDTEAFQSLRSRLRAIRESNPGLRAEHIYTFRQDGDSVRFVAFTHDRDDPYRPKIGEAYPLQPGMQSVLDGGPVFLRDLYTDQYGRWVSAYAPVRASGGEVVGLLEVDIPSQEYFRHHDAVTRWAVALALLALGVASVLGWFVLDFLVIQPLQAVHKGMEALSRQDFGHRVVLKTGDEFQELGQTLNTIAKELNAARKVQAGFFPRELPRHPGYLIASAWLPAEATAGDYYDVIPLAGDRLALVIADVSGHGLGPSLIMSACRSALRALAAIDLEPRELVMRLEAHLQDDLSDGRFITLLFGILEADGSFHYCNAGHGPAMALLGGEMVTLKSHRTPLGMPFPVAVSGERQTKLPLEPGDRLFLASDGVSEAENRRGEFFGVEPIEAVVRQRDKTCEEVVETLRLAVEDHIGDGERADDVTILCIDCIKKDDNT